MARGGNRSQMGHLFIVVLLALSLVSCWAAPSDWLIPHNAARQAVGAGIPDLAWDTTLEDYATNWANNQASNANCALTHSGGPYGENIYWASFASTPADAVTAWVNEKQYYDYSTNTCATNQVCGHYTQVVWRDTSFLGCGSVTCPAGGTFVVCSYNPPGNYVGQRPY